MLHQEVRRYPPPPLTDWLTDTSTRWLLNKELRALPLLLPITNQPVYTRECDRVYTIHLQSFIICKLISNNDFLEFVYSNESEYSKKIYIIIILIQNNHLSFSNKEKLKSILSISLLKSDKKPFFFFFPLNLKIYIYIYNTKVKQFFSPPKSKQCLSLSLLLISV